MSGQQGKQGQETSVSLNVLLRQSQGTTGKKAGWSHLEFPVHLVGGGAFAQTTRSVQAAAAAKAPLLVPKPRREDGAPQNHADHAEMANVHRASNANVKGKIQQDHNEAYVAGRGSRGRSRRNLLSVLRGSFRTRPHQQVVGGQQ